MSSFEDEPQSYRPKSSKFGGRQIKLIFIFIFVNLNLFSGLCEKRKRNLWMTL